MKRKYNTIPTNCVRCRDTYYDCVCAAESILNWMWWIARTEQGIYKLRVLAGRT